MMMKMIEGALWLILVALLGWFAGKELRTDEQKMADEVTHRTNLR